MSLDETETKKLVEHLLDLYSEKRNWQAVADDFGVPKIVVWRIANDGYVPQKNSIRRALGLPEIIRVYQKRDSHGRFMRKFGE